MKKGRTDRPQFSSSVIILSGSGYGNYTNYECVCTSLVGETLMIIIGHDDNYCSCSIRFYFFLVWVVYWYFFHLTSMCRSTLRIFLLALLLECAKVGEHMLFYPMPSIDEINIFTTRDFFCKKNYELFLLVFYGLILFLRNSPHQFIQKEKLPLQCFESTTKTSTR